MANQWRMARSVEVLRKQLNAKFPGRAIGSDGGIGDSLHSARASDHNPDSDGVVKARDFTHDPRSGCDGHKIVDALIASKDPRIKYIIWNRQIISGTEQSTPAWKRRAYTGKSPHTVHFHVSVKKAKKYYDDESPWSLDGVQAPTAEAQAAIPATPNWRMIKKGDSGDDVEILQKLLKFSERDQDGEFGTMTDRAVRAHQKKANLVVDGKVGRQTWDSLGRK